MCLQVCFLVFSSVLSYLHVSEELPEPAGCSMMIELNQSALVRDLNSVKCQLLLNFAICTDMHAYPSSLCCNQVLLVLKLNAALLQQFLPRILCGCRCSWLQLHACCYFAPAADCLLLLLLVACCCRLRLSAAVRRRCCLSTAVAAGLPPGCCLLLLLFLFLLLSLLLHLLLPRA